MDNKKLIQKSKESSPLKSHTENDDNKSTLNDLQNMSVSSIQLKLAQNFFDKSLITDQGEYVWLKLVTKGTFGTVYKIKHRETGKIFALKRVYLDPLYIQSEASILKELSHPNCIGYYQDFIYEDKRTEKVFLNIVMDYVPMTLQKIIQYYNRRGMEFPRLVGKLYSYQLLRALAYLRNKSIVHRDIKPNNILIKNELQKLLIADFGSAKKISDDTSSISYICSRYYRAPELILGDEKYRFAIDIWAAGCVIAEMFLGSPIFPGKNSADQLIQIIKVIGSPRKTYINELMERKSITLPNIKGCGINSKIPNIEPLLEDLLSKMLSYDPDERISALDALLHPYFDELRLKPIYINENTIVDIFDFKLEETDNDLTIIDKLTPDWYKKN